MYDGIENVIRLGVGVGDQLQVLIFLSFFTYKNGHNKVFLKSEKKNSPNMGRNGLYISAFNIPTVLIKGAW